MTSRVVEGTLDPAGLVPGTDDPASGALVVLVGGRDEGDAAASGGGAGSGSPGAVDGSADAAGVLAELEDEALDRFDVRRCRLRVRADASPGETSVAAVVRAPHRRAAFDAARWAVTSALGWLAGPGTGADGEADGPARPTGAARDGSPGDGGGAGGSEGEAPGRGEP